MKKQKNRSLSTPSVVMNGDAEVILEGHFRIEDYSSEKIVLDLKFRGKCAVICGEDLRLCVGAENVISIAGRIRSFSYAYLQEVKNERAY